MTVDLVIFGVLAVLAIGASLTVVLHPHPVYCALSLVIALFQIAGLFILLGAHMLGFLQVIVYAGAIMVLFLFVIMLLNVRRETEPVSAGWRAVVMASGAILAGELVWFFLRRPFPEANEVVAGKDLGSVMALGRSLFADHALSFELTSILLLVAMIGAVVVARKG
jgi:NADH-quinone oxidoreductase subunit J